MACYSAQDNENLQKKKRIMKKYDKYCFLSLNKSCIISYRDIYNTIFETCVSQVNPRGQSVVKNDSHFCFANRRERIE